MACWQGGPGGHGPPSEDFLGGAKTQRGRQNLSKALVKAFVTIRESDEPMKKKWTEFYRDLRSVWQCLCLCVCHRHTTLTITATPCARARSTDKSWTYIWYTYKVFPADGHGNKGTTYFVWEYDLSTMPIYHAILKVVWTLFWLMLKIVCVFLNGIHIKHSCIIYIFIQIHEGTFNSGHCK